MSRHPLSGLAAPYDVTTRRDMHFWRFASRSLVMGGAIRLLRDHDNAQILGRILRAQQRRGAVWVDGWSWEPVPDGVPLSVRFDVIEERRERGVRLILKARLLEVSVVKRAAFAAARTGRA